MRVYRGEKQGETGWSTIRCAAEKSRKAWTAYLKRPNRSYAEYVGQIMRLTTKYSSEMRKKDGAGKGSRSVKSILIAGASRKHFEYLQNNTAFRWMGAVAGGTMANEAVRKQVKLWGAGVRQQHAGRATTVGKAFGLYKTLDGAKIEVC